MPSVVHTKPREENRAVRGLKEQDYEVFLPLCRTRRRVEPRPLFPRYLFVWLRDDRPWRPILSTPGVSQLLLGTDDRPGEVPDEVIEEIRLKMAKDGGAILVRDTRQFPTPFQKGQKIRVIGGAYLGLEGLFLGRSKDRIVALLNIFGRQVKATVKEEDVR